MTAATKLDSSTRLQDQSAHTAGRRSAALANALVLQLAKQIVGSRLVLMLALLVLRPLMKSLTKPPSRLSRSDAGDLAGDKVSLSGRADNAIKLSPSFEQQIAAAEHGRAGSEACRASGEGLVAAMLNEELDGTSTGRHIAHEPG